VFYFSFISVLFYVRAALKTLRAGCRCVQPSPVNDAENDSVDETRRNTWYNETLATSDEFVGCWAPSDLHTAVSTAAPASGTTVVVSPSQRSTSTTTTTDPAGTPTSAVRARLMGTGCSPEPPREPPSSEPTSTATDTEERGTLLARVHALEKVRFEICFCKLLGC